MRIYVLQPDQVPAVGGYRQENREKGPATKTTSPFADNEACMWRVGDANTANGVKGQQLKKTISPKKDETPFQQKAKKGWEKTSKGKATLAQNDFRFPTTEK